MSRYRQSMTEAYGKVLKASEIKEFKKMKVTIQDMDKRKKAIADLMKQNLGVSVNGGVIRVDGKGKDLNNYAKDLMNFYGANVVAEDKDHEVSMARGELEAISDKALKLSSMLQGKSDEGNPLEAWVQSKITKAKDYINTVSDYMEYNPDDAMEGIEENFSDAQIARLKKEYEPLRNKKISIDNANKLGAMFSKFDSNKNALEKLYGGNIPFVSTMAMTRLMTKHGYKAAQLNKIRKESVELADELFILEEAHMLDEAEATISRFKGDKDAENIMSLAKQQGVKATRKGNQIHLKGVFRKVMDISMALQKNGMKVEEIMNEEKEYSDAEIGEMFGNKQIDPTTATALRHYLSKRAGGSPFPPIVEGMMSKIDAMQKDGKSAAQIAKELKLDVKTVKGILGEAIDGDDSYPPQQINRMKHKENPKKEKGEHPAKMKFEEIKGLRKKADKSGMPYGILKKVYDRGMAAWRGGHRPGASQQQWAFARVNSFVTKSSGTWGGADKDLAAKVKGSKK